MSAVPVRSFAPANRELVNAYERYLIARGNSAPTRRAYLDAVGRLAESLGSESIVNTERPKIRELFYQWQRKGLTDNSIRLHTCALRSFFKFIRLTGLTKHDPMLLIAHRKVATRLPVVLTVEQVEKLINAARDPFERAFVEVLYSTGVRISELVNLRLENIDFAERVILVKKGKGGKDRYVLFGAPAAKAIREYQEWRPSQAGFLFESPAQRGNIYLNKKWSFWVAQFYVDCKPRRISLGSVREIATKERARQIFDRLVTKIPGFKARPSRPYHPVSLRPILARLAHRAGLGHVHPHALRRAMASHMLQRGANLRVVQDLLGHERLNSTMRYTWLDANHIKEVHHKFHPHEHGADHGEK